jgi:membrane fusion protein (multidrug efflux system)
MKNATYVLLLLLIACAWSCAKKEAEEEDEESTIATSNVEVQAARVEQGDIRQIVSAGGTLAALPDRDVKISALVAGRVNQILVTEGAAVKAGQLVARIDDSVLRDQWKQAKAVLDNARANEERQAKLFERGIAAGKEKEDAHRDFISAQAEFETAQLQLGRARVHSPINGVVSKRFVNVGEQVDGTANQPILEVADYDPIELLANLSTSYLPFVHEGQEVEVSTEAFGNMVFRGKVLSILPAIDATTGSATLRIQVPNPDLRLKGSMFATAKIVTGDHPHALFVPATALVTSNEEAKVFVIGSDSKVQERRVSPGWRDGNRIEILNGVKSGEVVVTTGSYGLAEGMKVTVKS